MRLYPTIPRWSAFNISELSDNSTMDIDDEDDDLDINMPGCWPSAPTYGAAGSQSTSYAASSQHQVELMLVTTTSPESSPLPSPSQAQSDHGFPPNSAEPLHEETTVPNTPTVDLESLPDARGEPIIAARDNATRFSGAGTTAASFIPATRTLNGLMTPQPSLDSIDLGPRDSTAATPAFIHVAYSQHHQRQFDKRRLGWGVQWEIARLYSCGKLNWEDIVIPSLDHLVGSNAVAATKVSLDVLLGKTDVGQSGPPVRSPRRAVYEELDREQESLRAGDLLRLGALDGSPQGWFGGRVQQKMALFLRPNIPADRPFEERVIFRLLPQENGPSRRFGRYFGSRRILQLKVPKDIVNKHQSDLERYLVKAFVLLGRVFRAFSAKEHKVYFFETDEPYDGRKNIELEGDHERVSFKDFIWLHNKLDPQSSQMMSKWSSRFSLGLSSSEPGLRFDHAHVIKDRDILSSSFTGTGKPLPEEDMTDGCGLINSAALKALCRVMTLDHAPIAVQARIMGAKGLWLLHPTDRDVQPKIWLRPSQIKIGMQWTEDGTLDPHPSCLQDPVIDILRKGRFKTEVRLSKQSIICLSYGGVPSTVFFKLLEAGLERKVAPLLDWATPVGIKQLWFAIYEAGNLRDAKLRQAAGGLARSRGHVVDFDDTESAEEDILSDATTGGHWVDEKSGPPMSLHGLAMELLESGFRPVNTPILRKKLEWVVKGAVNDHIGNFNIPVPMSLQAWIAPDPLGVLDTETVHFCSSQSLLDVYGNQVNAITGEAVVGRNPIMLPSDMRKVHLLCHPELAQYKDILLFSTKGAYSLASCLSGGDYDGDTVDVFWDPNIVKSFQNSPLRSCAAPPDIEDAFDRKIEPMQMFMERIIGLADAEETRELQKQLLSGIVDRRVGLYSRFHSLSTYQRGYGDPETIRLAHIFTRCLDGEKTGRLVKEEIFRRDSRRNSGAAPECMSSTSTSDPNILDPNPIERPRHLPPFVLEELMMFGKQASITYLQRLDHLLSRSQTDLRPDKSLLDCKERFESRSQRFQQEDDYQMQMELEDIQHHVERLREGWEKMRIGEGEYALRNAPNSKPTSYWNHSPASRNAMAQKISEAFASVIKKHDFRYIDEEMVLPYAASYAYSVDMEAAGDCEFSFTVAFRELKKLKSGKNSVTTERSFEDMKGPIAGFKRILSQMEV